MKSKITLFFTILICFLLQSTVISRIAIGSITPNLILILCISMGLDERQKKRNVDGIFLRLSGGYVLWICFWVLCTDLYVYWFFKRICTQDLL